MLSIVKYLSEVQDPDISGARAAGIALKKGAQATGGAVGSAAKKTVEFAGEHPMIGGVALGALGVAGALGLRKLKKPV